MLISDNIHSGILPALATREFLRRIEFHTNTQRVIPVDWGFIPKLATSCRHLTILRLHSLELTDYACTYLQQCTTLQYLAVTASKLSDLALQQLLSLPNLQTLKLLCAADGCSFTDPFVSLSLSPLSLSTLKIVNFAIVHSDPFRFCQNLSTLCLRHCHQGATNFLSSIGRYIVPYAVLFFD